MALEIAAVTTSHTLHRDSLLHPYLVHLRFGHSKRRHSPDFVFRHSRRRHSPDFVGMLVSQRLLLASQSNGCCALSTNWPLRFRLSAGGLAKHHNIVSAACGGRSDGVGGVPGDEYGIYPWDPSWHTSGSNSIEWVQEDIVTFFTTDGLTQIGGSRVPRQILSTEKRLLRGRAPTGYRRFREEDYMDPKQGLCLGAIFDIAATNGLDTGRRFCVFGFCRSIEMLSDVVEDTVLEQGGEVVVAEKGNNGGLNEKLSMTVAMPLLWGVPPAVETLNYAIRSGGGIVEKVYWQWEFF